MERLFKKIEILDNKILKLSIELNELKKEEKKHLNKNSQSIRDVIIEVRKNLKKIEYDRLKYICGLSEYLFDKNLLEDKLTCNHKFDILNIKNKNELLKISSKCLICGYEETLYINKYFKSYHELNEYLNSKNENYKYIGGCGYVGALEKEQTYTLKN